MQMTRKTAQYIDPFGDSQYFSLNRAWGVDRTGDPTIIRELTTPYVWATENVRFINELQSFINVRDIRFGFAWWVPKSRDIETQYCIFTETEEDAVLLKLTLT